MPRSWNAEIEMFADYYKDYFGKYTATVAPLAALKCTGPVTYTGHAALAADIQNLKDAMAGLPIEEAFLPATSAFGFGRNAYYASEDDYLEVVGEAMREEYLAIVDAGLLLQIDSPLLLEVLADDPTTTLEQRRATAMRHVEHLNHTLRGIPPERVRLHVCYGLNHGPRLHDAPMRAWLDVVLRVNVGAISFEVANPRHQHEWRVWESVSLPPDTVLIPGLISHAHNFVEHAELIADSLETYARLVGRENVIAGADCGFSSRASFKPEVNPEVAWAKLQALADGARLASKRLFDG